MKQRSKSEKLFLILRYVFILQKNSLSYINNMQKNIAREVIMMYNNIMYFMMASVLPLKGS